MTTQKQIEANRRNSRRSTGPKTRTGKAESKMNAMKHGLLAADLVVRDEDPAEFAGVLESLIDELQPQGPLEEQLVERVGGGLPRSSCPRSPRGRLRNPDQLRRPRSRWNRGRP